jgi:hypothetical protein
VSLPCEWSWATSLSAAIVVAPYFGAHCGAHANVVLAEKFEYEHCPSPGLSAASDFEYPELSVSYLKPIEKYLAFEPRSGSKSKVYSQDKLTKRCDAKIEKFDMKTKFKKHTNSSIRSRN